MSFSTARSAQVARATFIRRRAVARGALAFGLATGLVVGFCASPASAGPPGTWTALSSGHAVTGIDEPGLARVGTSLAVVWSQDDGSSGESVHYRPVSAAGAAGTARTVVSGWSAVTNDPKVVVTPTGVSTLFSGIRTTSPSEQYAGHEMYRADAPAAATPWTLAPTSSFPTYGSPYASYGTGAVRDGTTVLTSYPLNAAINIVGSDGSSQTLSVPSCCAYNSNLVRDAASGAIWATWFANGSAAGAKGVFAQQVRPTLGSRLQLPGSITTNAYGTNTSSPDQAVAATTRAGGGGYVAYTMGYPTATAIRVQRLGSSAHTDVRASSVQRVSLSAYGSRLWLSWSSGDRVYATRSNRSATRFGAVHSVQALKHGASIYSLSTDGSTGRLDVVITAQGYPAATQVYHSQVLAGLSVTLSKKKVKRSKGGKVVVTVRDAGAAVAHATVKVGKKTLHTKRNGKAKIKVKKGSHKGKQKVKISARTYAPAKATFKIT